MKTITASIIIAVVIIGGTVMLAGGNKNSNNINSQTANNVSIVEDKQIITINAKGGYSPGVTTAKADIPTVIKMNTRGTFDCSAALTIPSLGYRKNLPPSGETEIELPPQKAGTIMQGMCSMGMYNFQVSFN